MVLDGVFAVSIAAIEYYFLLLQYQWPIDNPPARGCYREHVHAPSDARRHAGSVAHGPSSLIVHLERYLNSTSGGDLSLGGVVRVEDNKQRSSRLDR